MKHNQHIYILTFLVLLASCWFSCPVYSQERLVVPVFYATDRILNTDDVSNISFLNEQTNPVLVSYGIKNIVLINERISPNIERLDGLGWWNLLPGKDIGSPLINNTTLTGQELIEHIKQIVQNGPKDRPLIIYVNGCCVGFDASLEQAGKIAASMTAPVLVYAWSAKPETVSQYRDNEIRYRKGLPKFIEFVQAIENGIGTDRIVIVGYSMGNRLVHEMLQHRSLVPDMDKPKFRDIEFACADVSVDDFASDEERIALCSKHIGITKNNTDKALLLSQGQRGFYGRLGAPLGALKKLINTEGVDIFDIESICRGSHMLPIQMLTDVVRQTDNGYQSHYLFLQERPHLTKVKN